ncbi:hypothetical protein [Actinokineospora sp. HUAS TT18]|uniref:hypothetical protein n=1 Tax=Actinokineospora sp. HUAS TT18 TaxID=3447451 RepID=UPI003F5250D2
MVTQVALRAEVDHDLGGRWTSLRTDTREWLWHRAAPQRRSARPGTDFVDAGGLEECVPTVRGVPDHGDVWARPWQRTAVGWAVDADDFTLHRAMSHVDGKVVAEYELVAEPGYRFVWAAHALLDLSPTARLIAPTGTLTSVYDDAPVDGRWPDPLGTRLDELGPDDGTAVCAILHGVTTTGVLDGDDGLTFTLDCPEQPVGVALWRNLRGWPAADPYRSIGVEPMIGGVLDRTEPGPVAIVPDSGILRWRLTLTAYRGGLP